MHVTVISGIEAGPPGSEVKDLLELEAAPQAPNAAGADSVPVGPADEAAQPKPDRARGFGLERFEYREKVRPRQTVAEMD